MQTIDEFSSLRVDTILPYLVHRGFIDLEKAIDGDFAIIGISRRNQNFKVVSGQTDFYFVKQFASEDRDNIRTVKQELRFWELATVTSAFENLIPRLHGLDKEHCILMFELIPRSENLYEYHSRIERFSPMIAGLCGTLLAAFHTALAQHQLPKDFVLGCAQQVPWVFNLGSLKKEQSGGAREFLQFLRTETKIFSYLKALQNDWERQALMHGDMKWENCLVFSDAANQPELRLVDFEFADIGDPLWDCAGMIQSFFHFWLRTHQIALGEQAEIDLSQVIRQPGELERALRTNIVAFLRAYRLKRGQANWDSHQKEKLCRFVAGQLVLRSYESARNKENLTPFVRTSIEFADSLFEQNQAATRFWFPD